MPFVILQTSPGVAYLWGTVPTCMECTDDTTPAVTDGWAPHTHMTPYASELLDKEMAASHGRVVTWDATACAFVVCWPTCKAGVPMATLPLTHRSRTRQVCAIYKDNTYLLDCSCGYSHRMGIPCRHQLAVNKGKVTFPCDASTTGIDCHTTDMFCTYQRDDLFVCTDDIKCIYQWHMLHVLTICTLYSHVI